MDAIVDEAGGAVFVVIALPDDIDEVAERRFADFAADAVAVDVEDLLDALQLLRADDFAKLILREGDALAEDFGLFFGVIRRDGFQQRLAEASATAAAGGGAGSVFELGEGAEKQLFVQVPYCVFKLASALGKGFQGTKPEECLLQNLRVLSEHVDCRTYATEPWQLWEVFGACFHALRSNASGNLNRIKGSLIWLAFYNDFRYSLHFFHFDKKAL